MAGCRQAERHGFRRQALSTSRGAPESRSATRPDWERRSPELTRRPSCCVPGADFLAPRSAKVRYVKGAAENPSPFRGICSGRVVDRDRVPSVGHRLRATRSSPGARSRRPSRRHGAEGTARCPRTREPWLDSMNKPPSLPIDAANTASATFAWSRNNRGVGQRSAW